MISLLLDKQTLKEAIGFPIVVNGFPFYVISRTANSIPETDIGVDRRQSGPTMLKETPENLKYDGNPPKGCIKPVQIVG